MKDISYLKKEIFNGISNEGFYGPINIFDESELKPINLEFKKYIKSFFNFENNKDIFKSIENAKPILPPNDFDKTLFQSTLKKFAGSNNVKNIFKQLLGDNLQLSQFNDIRFNYANTKTIGVTGWHQDIETLFSHFKKELGFDFLTMWVAFTKSSKKIVWKF